MEKKETLAAIEECIKALEEEVKAQKVQNKRLRVVIAALVVLAVLPYLIAAGMQTQTFSVLRVERLEFVRDGEVVAIMRGGAIPGGFSGLGICDGDGKPVVAIGSFTGGPLAGFQGLLIGFARVEGGAGFFVTPDGNGGMFINNKYGKPVAVLTAYGKEDVARVGDGFLGIYDRDGNRILTASVDPILNSSKLQIYRTPGQGDTGKAAVTIGVLPGGSGVIVTSNSLGLPIWSSPLR